MKLKGIAISKRPKIKLIITEKQAERLTDRLINEGYNKMNNKILSK